MTTVENMVESRRLANRAGRRCTMRHSGVQMVAQDTEDRPLFRARMKGSACVSLECGCAKHM